METPVSSLSVTYNSEQSEVKSISPQGLVSKFWFDFHSQTPGKVTQVLPPSRYGLRTYSEPPSLVKAFSYEEAAQQCRFDVRAIVKECERTNHKFSDPTFDIEKDFLDYDYHCLFGIAKTWDDDEDRCTKPGSVHRISWIFEKPEFVTNGFVSDIKQGASSNCWWLAALASVSLRKQLIKRVCVARDEDCGVYGFVFFRDGGWVWTVVDDNLYLTEKDFNQDVHDSTGGRARLYRKQQQMGSKALFFSKCGTTNETWLPLLEKAVNSPTVIKLSPELTLPSLLRSMETMQHSTTDGLVQQLRTLPVASPLYSKVIEYFARSGSGVSWLTQRKEIFSSLYLLVTKVVSIEMASS
jgi:hypothetical protein